MNNHAWLTVAQAVSLVSCLRLGTAFGQNTAASEALFQRGVSAMLRSDYASACPSLQESYALEPRAGTKFALAECEAKWGHIATALAQYSDYLGIVDTMPAEQRQRHAVRVAVAQKQIDTLRARVPMVTLRLAANAPAGTVVIRDGVVLSRVSLGMETPVDPGKHVILTQVPRGGKHEMTFDIAPGEHKQLELELESIHPEPIGNSAAVSPPEREAKPNKTGSSHTWTYVTGGIGVAGIAVGTVTGIMALQKKRVVDDNCVSSSCNANGLDAANAGRTFGIASTIGFGVGLAGLAAAVALWFAAPPNQVAERGRRNWSPIVAGNGRSAALLGIRGQW